MPVEHFGPQFSHNGLINLISWPVCHIFIALSVDTHIGYSNSPDLEKIPDFLGTQLRTQIFSWKTRDFGPFEYRDKDRKILPKLTSYTIHTGIQFPG